MKMGKTRSHLFIFLQLLGVYDMTNSTYNRAYLMETQDEMIGGFAKWPENNPGRQLK